MNRYSAQPGDSYGFLPFAKNVTKNVYGSISKILRSNYSKKLLDYDK